MSEFEYREHSNTKNTKRILHGGAKIRSLSSSEFFFTREDKLHIFKPTCNFLFIT